LRPGPVVGVVGRRGQPVPRRASLASHAIAVMVLVSCATTYRPGAAATGEPNSKPVRTTRDGRRPLAHRRRRKSATPKTRRSPDSVPPEEVLTIWQTRFALAASPFVRPLHDIATRFITDFGICVVCEGNTWRFCARLETPAQGLWRAMTYTRENAPRLLVLLWWYWQMMHAYQLKKHDWTTIHDPETDTVKPLGSRPRVAAHRARALGTTRTFDVVTFRRPLFTGTITVPPGHVKGQGNSRRGESMHRVQIPPPEKQRSGRPPATEDPLFLIPLVVAKLLHQWFPARTKGPYLAWSVIMDLLKEFVPQEVDDFVPKPPPKGFKPTPAPLGWTPDFLKRLVRRYQDDPSLKSIVLVLESRFLPAARQGFTDR
jgi:hypothetical protein